MVHWYASGSIADILPEIDEPYVGAHRQKQLFSRLACAVLDDELPALLDA